MFTVEQYSNKSLRTAYTVHCIVQSTVHCTLCLPCYYSGELCIHRDVRVRFHYPNKYTLTYLSIIELLLTYYFLKPFKNSIYLLVVYGLKVLKFFRLFDWLIDSLIDWSIDWLGYWRNNRILTGWLIAQILVYILPADVPELLQEVGGPHLPDPALLVHALILHTGLRVEKCNLCLQ